MTGKELYEKWAGRDLPHMRPWEDLRSYEQTRWTNLGNEWGTLVADRQALRRKLDAIEDAIRPREDSA